MKVKKVLSMFLVFIMTVMIVACNNQGAVQEEAPVEPEGETEISKEPAEKPDKQYVLKHCHVLASTEPFNQGFLNWAKAVEERTNGGLIIEVFPAGQMGVEEDLLEQAKEGVNVGHNTDSARLGMYVEEIAVMNGPYFVDDLDEVQKLKDSASLQGYIDEVKALD